MLQQNEYQTNMIETSNEELIDKPISADFKEEIKNNEIETSNIEQSDNDKEFLETNISDTENLIETDNFSDHAISTSTDLEKSNDTNVRRLSLFDTLSTDNNLENNDPENVSIEKTEPVLHSSKENIDNNEEDIDKKLVEDDYRNINEETEFSGEEIIIGYNSEYLKDIVSHISGETVEIKLNNPVSAALFEETPKRENIKSLMLLMPIRLND